MKYMQFRHSRIWHICVEEEGLYATTKCGRATSFTNCVVANVKAIFGQFCIQCQRAK